MAENGGQYGYIDNIYPCGIFGPKGLREVSFREVTIFYGGNGSGKSTLLNLIAAKLELNRVAPHSSGELFDAYARQCRYAMGCDDEGFKYRIPNGSRIITSDDVFDYMLTVRTNNDDIREEIERGKDEHRALKFGETIKFYCGCQLIIATHSPFLLSLDGALIYDLDASPVDIKNWWELENARVYYDFSKQHEELFGK